MNQLNSIKIIKKCTNSKTYNFPSTNDNWGNVKATLDRMYSLLQQQTLDRMYSSLQQQTLDRMYSLLQQQTLGRMYSPLQQQTLGRMYSPLQQQTLGRMYSPLQQQTLGRMYSPLQQQTLGRMYSPLQQQTLDRMYSPLQVLYNFLVLVYKTNKHNQFCVFLLRHRRTVGVRRPHFENRECSGHLCLVLVRVTKALSIRTGVRTKFTCP